MKRGATVSADNKATVIRWLVVFSWLLYVSQLISRFPIPPEGALRISLALVASVVGITAVISSVKHGRRWRLFAGIAAAAFLLAYACGIALLVADSSAGVFGLYKLEWQLLTWKYQNTGLVSALRFAYEEMAMPILQALVLLLLAMHPNSLLNADASRAGAG